MYSKRRAASHFPWEALLHAVTPGSYHNSSHFRAASLISETSLVKNGRHECAHLGMSAHCAKWGTQPVLIVV
jgi:hypothetical protein